MQETGHTEMTIPYAGNVSVPLFDAHADTSFLSDNNIKTFLNGFSDWPLVQRAVQSAANSIVIDSITSVAFGISVADREGALSIIAKDPTLLTTTNGLNNLVDGNGVYTSISQKTGGGGHYVNVFAFMQSIIPNEYGTPGLGSYLFKPEALESNLLGGTLANGGVATKASYLGAPVFGGLWTGNNNDFILRPWYGNIASSWTGPKFDGVNSTVLGSQRYVQCRLPPQGLFDNAACFASGSGFFGTQPGLFMWNSQTSDYGSFGLAIDDTGLPGNLAALFAAASPSVWSNGYWFALQTNGAGPNKTQFEIVMLDAMASTWWIINFVAQDAAAANAMNSQVTEGVSFTVDPNGIMWFNPNYDSTKFGMLTSYSPISFQIPWIYPQLLNPITLPCYNTCNPVTYRQPPATTEPTQ